MANLAESAYYSLPVNEKSSKFVIGLVAAAAIIVTVMITRNVFDREYGGPDAYAEPINPSLPAPEFALIDQTGQPFGSEQLKGKVYLIDFIFTECPGPCPAMTAAMAELQKSLKADKKFKDVMLVSVSLDPEKDTPQRLTDYATMYGADSERWKFLTGDREEIWTMVREGFKQPVEYADDENATGHRIVHSQRFMLVDRVGNIRGWFRGIDDANLGPDEIDELMTVLEKVVNES